MSIEKLIRNACIPCKGNRETDTAPRDTLWTITHLIPRQSAVWSTICLDTQPWKLRNSHYWFSVRWSSHPGSFTTQKASNVGNTPHGMFSPSNNLLDPSVNIDLEDIPAPPTTFCIGRNSPRIRPHLHAYVMRINPPETTQTNLLQSLNQPNPTQPIGWLTHEQLETHGWLNQHCGYWWPGAQYQ